MAVLAEQGATVLGHFAVDRIDGAAPTPGGCPSFAGFALEALGGGGRIVARAAAADRPLFASLCAEAPADFTVLPAAVTSGFGLRYDGEDRVMSVDAIGDAWTPADIEAAAPRTRWVHVAALLRSDFPLEAMAALSEAGHRVGYDGQGLVRVPRCGDMAVDAGYDPALLAHIDVLKLNEEEAEVVAGGPFGPGSARALGVPEVVVTLGSRGSKLFVDGTAVDIPARPVHGVHTTGAGDVFTVAYIAMRARGAAPGEAARRATGIVEDMLSARKAGLAGASPA